MRTPEEINRIVDSVQEHLDKENSPLKVYDKRVDDDWLIIAVRSQQPGIRAYDYVEILSKVENELLNEGTENLILVPALMD